MVFLGLLISFLAFVFIPMSKKGRIDDKEMACIPRPRITPQTQIFSYNQSIFVCHIQPKYLGFLWFVPSLGVCFSCSLLDFCPLSNEKRVSFCFLYLKYIVKIKFQSGVKQAKTWCLVAVSFLGTRDAKKKFQKQLIP